MRRRLRRATRPAYPLPRPGHVCGAGCCCLPHRPGRGTHVVDLPPRGGGGGRSRHVLSPRRLELERRHLLLPRPHRSIAVLRDERGPSPVALSRLHRRGSVAASRPCQMRCHIASVVASAASPRATCRCRSVGRREGGSYYGRSNAQRRRWHRRQPMWRRRCLLRGLPGAPRSGGGRQFLKCLLYMVF